MARDLEGLMDRYAADAILESPLILMALTDAASGILRGRSEIRPFFAAGLREVGNGLGRWYRTGTFFSDGRQLTREYPRATPQGDQVDLVAVMDLAAAASPIIGSSGAGWGSGADRPRGALPMSRSAEIGAYATENRNSVVAAKVSPGRSTADGKAGWFGASGKSCVSKQTPSPER